MDQTQQTSGNEIGTDGLGSDGAGRTAEHTAVARPAARDRRAVQIDRAADQLDRFSTRLRERNVSELLHDAQQLARRQPALFIGGAFVLGLLGARFLKSSSDRQPASPRPSRGSHEAAHQLMREARDSVVEGVR